MLSAASARLRRMVACIPFTTAAIDGEATSPNPPSLVCAATGDVAPIRQIEKRSFRSILVVLRRLIRAQPITIQQSTINEVLLSALFSGFVKTRARIISYRHSARKDCQEGFMLRKMGGAVAEIFCWWSIDRAQAVEETTGQQQPATKIAPLDLRGVLNE